MEAAPGKNEIYWTERLLFIRVMVSLYCKHWRAKAKGTAMQQNCKDYYSYCRGRDCADGGPNDNAELADPPVVMDTTSRNY